MVFFRRFKLFDIYEDFLIADVGVPTTIKNNPKDPPDIFYTQLAIRFIILSNLTLHLN